MTSKTHPLYYKYASDYYRFTEVERFWSPVANQYVHTFRGTKYYAFDGKLYVDNNASITLGDEDRQKMEMVTRKTVMAFIGKSV